MSLKNTFTHLYINNGIFSIEKFIFARIMRLIFVNRSRIKGLWKFSKISVARFWIFWRLLDKIKMLMQLKKCDTEGHYSSVKHGRQWRNKYIEQKPFTSIFLLINIWQKAVTVFLGSAWLSKNAYIDTIAWGKYIDQDELASPTGISRAYSFRAEQQLPR